MNLFSLFRKRSRYTLSPINVRRDTLTYHRWWFWILGGVSVGSAAALSWGLFLWWSPETKPVPSFTLVTAPLIAEEPALPPPLFESDMPPEAFAAQRALKFLTAAIQTFESAIASSTRPDVTHAVE